MSVCIRGTNGCMVPGSRNLDERDNDTKQIVFLYCTYMYIS